MAAETITLDAAAAQNASQAGASSPGYGETRSKIAALVVQHPPAPSAFKGVSVGPEYSLNWDEPQDHDQVELSDSLLRNLSPFVIQVELPAVFADLGTPAGSQAPGTPRLDIYGTANGGLATYDAARAALQSSATIGGLLGYNLGTAVDTEEFVVRRNDVQGLGLKGASFVNPQDVQVGTPAQEDYLSASDIQRQLIAILEAPPLVLLINPTSLRLNITKIQQYQDRTRYGYMLHTWGDDQLKVSITAVCGAFISGGKNGKDGRGVSAASKRDSLAWQNMMNLVHFYKSNGYIYDTIGKSNAHLHVGALSIRYDNWIYYGNMESLNFTFEETKNLGGMEFSMEFVANRKLDVSTQWFNVLPMKSPIPSLSDPRYQSSGGSNRPGHYQWNIGENRIEHEGQAESDNSGVGVGEFFGGPVAGVKAGFAASVEAAGGPVGVKNQPLGTGGVQGVDTAISKEQTNEKKVQQIAPDQSNPFGIKGGKIASPTSTVGA